MIRRTYIAASPACRWASRWREAAAIGYPLYELVKPGQPAPFDRYPLIAAGVVAAALIWGAVAFARDRTLGERVGSIVADSD